MDFINGLLALFIIGFLVSSLVRWLKSPPYTCVCGWKCYSEEEMITHVLTKNVHRQVEPKPQK